MRRTLAVITAILFALAGLVGIAAPANAAAYCDGHWLWASWGRGCVGLSVGQVQDVLTDGYCVDAKAFNFTTRVWEHLANSTSCGSIASFNPTDRSCIRMVRGDGRYLTLRATRTDCP